MKKLITIIVIGMLLFYGNIFGSDNSMREKYFERHNRLTHGNSYNNTHENTFNNDYTNKITTPSREKYFERHNRLTHGNSYNNTHENTFNNTYKELEKKLEELGK